MQLTELALVAVAAAAVGVAIAAATEARALRQSRARHRDRLMRAWGRAAELRDQVSLAHAAHRSTCVEASRRLRSLRESDLEVKDALATALQLASLEAWRAGGPGGFRVSGHEHAAHDSADSVRTDGDNTM